MLLASIILPTASTHLPVRTRRGPLASAREHARRSERALGLAGLVWIVLLASSAAGCGASLPRLVVPLQDPGANRAAVDTAHARLVAAYEVGKALLPARVEAALWAARARTREAQSRFVAESPDVLLAAARGAYDDERFADGWGFFVRSKAAGDSRPELYQLHAEAQLLGQNFAAAREAAFDGLDAHAGDTVLARLGDRAIDEDLVLVPPSVRTLVPTEGHVLKALGGGSTITLKLEVNGEKLAAVKPDQDLGQSMFRSEIAYYRLCAMLRCHFRVPHNEEVRVSRSDFKTLYGRVDSPKQRGYASKFGHLTWKPGADGVEYLHATFKEWVPAFVSFPIEATAAWQGWLAIDARQRDLAAPATEWLPSLAEAAGPRGWDHHKQRMTFAESLSMGDVVSQLADLLAVDFLTNNWDRFSGGVELYGANCHIEPGGLVAIDNGASFPPWHTERVAKRVALTQKFSKRLVYALRRMDHDRTLIRLFPTPNADELKRYEIFWERRAQLLEIVDGLIAKYGEDAVLAF